jgi:hypothetical protein
VLRDIASTQALLDQLYQLAAGRELATCEQVHDVRVQVARVVQSFYDNPETWAHRRDGVHAFAARVGSDVAGSAWPLPLS